MDGGRGLDEMVLQVCWAPGYYWAWEVVADSSRLGLLGLRLCLPFRWNELLPIGLQLEPPLPSALPRSSHALILPWRWPLGFTPDTSVELTEWTCAQWTHCQGPGNRRW